MHPLTKRGRPGRLALVRVIVRRLLEAVALESAGQVGLSYLPSLLDTLNTVVGSIAASIVIGLGRR